MFKLEREHTSDLLTPEEKWQKFQEIYGPVEDIVAFRAMETLYVELNLMQDEDRNAPVAQPNLNAGEF